MHASGRRAGYGIDAPGRTTGLVVVAVIALLVTVFAGQAAGLTGAALPALVSIAASVWVAGAVWTAQRGKLDVWRSVLDELDLAGDESALDLGCGRGLVLLEVARRLPEGHAVGLDRWDPRAQSGNHPSVTMANADLVAVADRVEVHTADVTSLPDHLGPFDLVTAGWLLRTLPDDAARRAVVAGAARALSPGGRLVVVDPSVGASAADAARDAGLVDVTIGRRRWRTLPPCRSLVGTRPGIGG